ncbi:transmembrane protein 42 [Oryzias melastigma]|uniref:Transmembrane protein 42a n=1 Tax=Oryzias melastigma TaxID=30732 RepID=A0A3B3CJJ1_ORYME|nr:transmembrane protein 42 [Oryzias melastigma]
MSPRPSTSTKRKKKTVWVFSANVVDELLAFIVEAVVSIRGSWTLLSAAAALMLSETLFALAAGLLAATASLSAKLSLGTDVLGPPCEADAPGGGTCNKWLHVPVRLLCGALMLGCNALMWTFFSRALRHSSSSARTTVTTSSSSFIFSGVLGRLMFGENHGPLWWTGISLALCGLLLLHGTPRPPGDCSSKDK